MRFALQNSSVSLAKKRLPRPWLFDLLPSRFSAGSAHSMLNMTWLWKSCVACKVGRVRSRRAKSSSNRMGPVWPGQSTGTPPWSTAKLLPPVRTPSTMAARGIKGKTKFPQMFHKIPPIRLPNLCCISVRKPKWMPHCTSSWFPRVRCTDAGMSRFKANNSNRISNECPPLSTMSPLNKYWFVADGLPYLKNSHNTSSNCPWVSPTMINWEPLAIANRCTFDLEDGSQKPRTSSKVFATAAAEKTCCA
mmetsp:Transcript_118880/g.341441  ORF Transcript_118880/g.341441 Transcript_118880/m.341441 type:complete len:248 (+) Transcript_118880:1606-2349(+)